MTTERSIPLSQLIHSDANVRLTARTEGIEALAASIAAHGLRQNLNVIATDDPKRFAVVAGGRAQAPGAQAARQAGQARPERPHCLHGA